MKIKAKWYKAFKADDNKKGLQELLDQCGELPDDLVYFLTNYSVGVPDKELFFYFSGNNHEVKSFFKLYGNPEECALVDEYGVNTCTEDEHLIPIFDTLDGAILFYSYTKNSYFLAYNYTELSLEKMEKVGKSLLDLNIQEFEQ